MKVYPTIDGHRQHHVRYPVEVTESSIPKDSLIKFELGKWVAVDVLKKGYRHLIAPMFFDTEEECMKGCNIHNNYHRWSEKEVEEIIGSSMVACMPKT